MDIREEFEKLPEIAELINGKKIKYHEDSELYYGCDSFDGGFINGAWYAFVEKRKEIDTLKDKLNQLEKWVEFHIEDYDLSESDSEHDRGWFNAACQVSKLLKEVPNE